MAVRTGKGGRVSVAPRIRTLKPDMQKDRALAGVSRDARHLFTGLVTQSDDEGRQDVDPRLIHAAWYPFDDDVTNSMIVEWRDELSSAGLLTVYEIDGVIYGELPGFTDNQVIRKPTPSKIPPPPRKPAAGAGSARVQYQYVTDDASVGTEGNGGERKGLEEREIPSTDLSLSSSTGSQESTSGADAW